MLIVYSVKTANLLKLENNWFIKSEKEITGDIVQGLPRIEEILEARKKEFNNKTNSN
jgi:hypothetical protein